jgi:hypothetical protein
MYNDQGSNSVVIIDSEFSNFFVFHHVICETHLKAPIL